MFFPLVLALIGHLGGAPVAADPAPTERYFVVEFAPLGQLRASEIRHWLTFEADRPDKKPLKWKVSFKPSDTTIQVRDDAFTALERSDCKVKKVGETKILFYGCQSLILKTEHPGRKEFDPEARPTVKEYATEKAALEAK
jgi:hypothetical protein